MRQAKKYYLVEESALPDVLLKTTKATELINMGKEKTICGAVKAMNLSRAAYYKYKDAIKPFNELERDKIITVLMQLEDITGVLSGILNVLAKKGANILTINQNIPVGKVAHVTVTFEAAELLEPIDELLNAVQRVSGVLKIEIISGGL